MYLPMNRRRTSATSADTYMSVEDGPLFGGKFAVEICVELCLPTLAEHHCSAAPAVDVPLALFWHATSVTSQCL